MNTEENLFEFAPGLKLNTLCALASLREIYSVSFVNSVSSSSEK